MTEDIQPQHPLPVPSPRAASEPVEIDVPEPGPRPSWLRRFLHWAARTGLEQKFTVALAIAAILSGLATYITAGGASPFEASPATLLLLLYINLVMLLVFGAVVAKRLVEIWVQRRRGLAGSRLHIRLVMLFSAVAVTPAIIVGIFSYLFIGIGMTSWFSDKVSTALTESRAVAQAYLQEHQQIIRADALAMAADLNREGFRLFANRQLLDGLLDAEVNTRQLTESIVFDRSTRQVVGSSTLSFGLQFEPIPEWAVQRAESDEVAVLTSANEDRVRALIKLDNIPNAMLYVGRPIERRVIDYVKKTTEAVDQYKQLEEQRSNFQIKFVFIYGAAAMLLLLVSVWVGLNFATGISRRIAGLVVAAEMVRGGDLSARVAEGNNNDEFGSLRRAFNRMTDQIESQQGELVEANRQLDYRRRFTEAVLSGVSAGVIGLDEHGVVTLPNRPASVLLGLEFDQMMGQPLAEVLPEMAALIETAMDQPGRRAEGQIKLLTPSRVMTLLVRITAETGQSGQGEIKGYVVTFDDITELLSAQRKAAWADVARRIAHEIKNPLTPIQLSAERLKRKYLGEITSDKETFSLCTDTIIRQVGDIGRMVDEFSSFARMPAPVMREENLTDIARQAVFLQRTANSDIDFDVAVPDRPMLARCDSRQISQALINLVQNAVDSIQGRMQDGDKTRGKIRVELAEEGGRMAVSVSDNGRGLPKDGRERLTEPYVTTRTKGTGLGLAIVKKIMEDHAGELILEDAPERGARVSLVFSRGEATQKQGMAGTVQRMEVEPHGA